MPVDGGGVELIRIDSPKKSHHEGIFPKQGPPLFGFKDSKFSKKNRRESMWFHLFLQQEGVFDLFFSGPAEKWLAGDFFRWKFRQEVGVDCGEHYTMDSLGFLESLSGRRNRKHRVLGPPLKASRKKATLFIGKTWHFWGVPLDSHVADVQKLYPWKEVDGSMVIGSMGWFSYLQ